MHVKIYIIIYNSRGYGTELDNGSGIIRSLITPAVSFHRHISVIPGSGWHLQLDSAKKIQIFFWLLSKFCFLQFIWPVPQLHLFPLRQFLRGNFLSSDTIAIRFWYLSIFRGSSGVIQHVFQQDFNKFLLRQRCFPSHMYLNIFAVNFYWIITNIVNVCI